MTKPPKTQDDRDPWDIANDDLRDPWDDPVETDSNYVEVPFLPSDEDDEDDGDDDGINSSVEDADEWEIKYPPMKQALRKSDIEGRRKRKVFLSILAKTGSPKKGALHVGLTPRALYLARDRFPDFAKNWDIAIEIYKNFVADEAIRKRAIDGVMEPQWFQGKIVGYQVKYDSGLTQFWAKSNMRDKYGDKSELQITGNVNHGIAFMPPPALSVAAWEQQAQKTLENQKMIDITPSIVDTKPVNVQKSGQTKIER